MRTSQIRFGLTTAAFMLAVAAGLKYAQGLELVGAETVQRAVQVSIGLALAIYGNFIPKDGALSRTPVCSRPQALMRFGGWAFALAGLAYAGFWALAPIRIADMIAMPIVATATVVTAGYCALVVLSCRRSQDQDSLFFGKTGK